jgi:hypothetical protein
MRLSVARVKGRRLSVADVTACTAGARRSLIALLGKVG